MHVTVAAFMKVVHCTCTHNYSATSTMTHLELISMLLIICCTEVQTLMLHFLPWIFCCVYFAFTLWPVLLCTSCRAVMLPPVRSVFVFHSVVSVLISVRRLFHFLCSPSLPYYAQLGHRFCEPKSRRLRTVAYDTTASGYLRPSCCCIYALISHQTLQ